MYYFFFNDLSFSSVEFNNFLYSQCWKQKILKLKPEKNIFCQLHFSILFKPKSFAFLNNYKCFRFKIYLKKEKNSVLDQFVLFVFININFTEFFWLKSLVADIKNLQHCVIFFQIRFWKNSEPPKNDYLNNYYLVQY